MTITYTATPTSAQFIRGEELQARMLLVPAAAGRGELLPPLPTEAGGGDDLPPLLVGPDAEGGGSSCDGAMRMLARSRATKSSFSRQPAMSTPRFSAHSESHGWA